MDRRQIDTHSIGTGKALDSGTKWVTDSVEACGSHIQFNIDAESIDEMNERDVPVRLSIDDQAWLIIEWSSSGKRRYSVRELREHCPCATCREKRQAEAQKKALFPILKPEELEPLRIHNMRPVGNYAYSIGFSDGHASGIFPLEMLLQLGEPVPGP